MAGYVRWKDIRAEHVSRAGGEEAVAAGKDRLREAAAAILSMDLEYSADAWQADHQNHPGECA
ncbi:hypothetical protein [Nonomuraea cypriaca]|uniref:hypothetical protein n=1 Tax=Nonomuraea cypriaca TaxID=1187855 RepID=UPI001A9CA6AC|nr:hypothetical protein [Nonomuraea cypriaca]